MSAAKRSEWELQPGIGSRLRETMLDASGPRACSPLRETMLDASGPLACSLWEAAPGASGTTVEVTA